MEENKQTSHWLFKQSSELEILISAAIVFAAVTVSGIVPEFLVKVINLNVPNSSPFLVLFAFISLFLSTLLPISIVTHFILRFYWLSLLGLKSAFAKQNIEKLDFDKKYLKSKKFKGLDRHILSIDKIASALFAFSFMTIFIFCFGIIIPFSILSFIDGELINDIIGNNILRYPAIAFFLLFAFACLITLIDFLTLGAVKKIKNKWVVKFYYPINKFMNVITLSFFYKDIYYTLVTNVSKKILIPVLPIYLILAILLLNSGYYESKIYTDGDVSLNFASSQAYHSAAYADQMTSRTIVSRPFISSVVQTGNLLKLSVPLTEKIDDTLVACDSVQAIQSRGVHWRKWIQMGWNNRDLPEGFSNQKNIEAALACFSDAVTVKIDTLLYEQPMYKFAKHQHPDKLVIVTYLDIADLPRGDHVLHCTFNIPNRTFSIPFVKD